MRNGYEIYPALRKWENFTSHRNYAFGRKYTKVLSKLRMRNRQMVRFLAWRNQSVIIHRSRTLDRWRYRRV